MYPDPTGPKVGDPVPNFALPDASGTLCVVRTPEVAGHMAAILFVGDVHSPAGASELAACAELAPAFAEAGTKLLAVTPADPTSDALPQSPGTLRVRGDMEGKALAEFGIDKASDRNLPAGFVVNRNSVVVAVVSSGDVPLAVQALEEIRRPEHHPVGEALSRVAPVLEIPGVFEPEFCAELIDLWASDNKETGTDNIVDAPASSEIFKIRRDHLVRDAETMRRIQRRLALRIVPEIEKVFFFKVTRQEAVRIGRYDSARQAYFKPHRDNIPPNTYRRFALTLNLNEDFVGGELRFPEYGPHTYRSATGGAIVFPCSLIHEALPVTEGDRFAVISFFFGEAEYQAYQREREARGAATN